MLQALAALSRLQTLELILRDFEEEEERQESAAALTASLQHMTQLTALQLEAAFLDDDVVSTWPTWLAQLHSSAQAAAAGTDSDDA